MKILYKLSPRLLKTIALICKKIPRFILDIRYYKWTKRHINWSSPQNIQEYSLSLLFRKDTDLNLYADLADKVNVRKFIEDRIGKQYLTKLYGVWKSAYDIDFNALPEKFVLKTNNGCGANFVIKNINTIDTNKVIKDLNFWLQFPYGELTGQVHYSMIKPLVLAEEYLEQVKGEDILPYDYKFFCYKGEPKYILYYEGRLLNSHMTPNMLFDMEWTAIPDAVCRPTNHRINKPESFEEMKSCVKRLCEGFEFVRVDFYEIGGRPIFGEMTFTPDILVNIKQDFKPLMKIYEE